MNVSCNVFSCHVRSCTRKEDCVIISLGSLLDDIRKGGVDECAQIVHQWVHEGDLLESENVWNGTQQRHEWLSSWNVFTALSSPCFIALCPSWSPDHYIVHNCRCVCCFVRVSHLDFHTGERRCIEGVVGGIRCWRWMCGPKREDMTTEGWRNGCWRADSGRKSKFAWHMSSPDVVPRPTMYFRMKIKVVVS